MNTNNECCGLTTNQITKHETQIMKLIDTAKKNIFEICVRLMILDDNNVAQERGYNNIAEYSAAVFGFARSTTLNYIKIARQYLAVQYDERKTTPGIKAITTICCGVDTDGNQVDYKIGQLNALGKATAGDFEIMHSEGVISPKMSADAIKKAVKNWYEPEEEPEQENEPDPYPLEMVKQYIENALDIINKNGLPGEIARGLQDALQAIYDVEEV